MASGRFRPGGSGSGDGERWRSVFPKGEGREKFGVAAELGIAGTLLVATMVGMQWRIWWLWIGFAGMVAAGPLDDFKSAAKAKHGAPGERAAEFLIANLPDRDRNDISVALLTENLDLAFQARAEFPWAKDVPEAIFFNDVLPYAVFDETRDPWRAEYYEKARTLVKDARTASEAVQALNRQWFNLIKVHYNTGRKRPNQSQKESRELGKATCTGLSIILVEACRAVGIPARAVGTPMWTNERGNHTWVEIWDGDWKFTGADEYDAAGLNRGWFVGDAAQAKAEVPRYSIFATSWKRAGTYFPMVWAPDSEVVPAVNVTSRYAKPGSTTTIAPAVARLGVRLIEHPGGPRMITRLRAVDPAGRLLGDTETKGERADLNDLARFELTPGATGWLRFAAHGETREMPFGPIIPGEPLLDAVWTALPPASTNLMALEAWLRRPVADRPADASLLKAPLTAAEAERALALLSADRTAQLATERQEEFANGAITADGKTLRWLEKLFGDPPAGGRSLWISMHGGGGAPTEVNDQQWRNQITLYQPEEGYYVAPRAPTDAWNMWHEGHIDPLFQRLIEDYVVLRGVDPNRIYLMGYSAGGDGVWQVAPRMADRFAAAAMMAGHPNEASLLGLRNLPFAIFMGANDAAYNRNRLAGERTAELDRLATADPGGYVHYSRIYEGLGHWMNRKDAEGVPWMAQYRRLPWPKRVVWQQDDVVERRFYWLQVPDSAVLKDRAKMVATLEDRLFRLEGDVPRGTRLRLSDALLDLSQPIRVTVNGREVFAGMVTRTAGALQQSLRERADAPSAASVLLSWD